MVFREGGKPNIPEFGDKKPSEDEIALAAEKAFSIGLEETRKERAQRNAEEYQKRALGGKKSDEVA